MVLKCSLCSYRYEHEFIEEECPSCGTKGTLSDTGETSIAAPPAPDQPTEQPPVDPESMNTVWTHLDEE